ncbi:MAG: hypothetical protein ACE5G3_11900, partial [Gammaproteobacteria bacterium]
KSSPGAAVIAMLAAALAVDNAALAAASVLGGTELAGLVDRCRHALHMTTGPIAMIAAVQIAAAAHMPTLRSGPGCWAAWAFVTGALGYGIADAITGFRMAPGCLDTLLRHASVVPADQACLHTEVLLHGGGIPVLFMISDTVVTIIGAIIWGKQSWPWMFAGSVVLFAAAQVPEMQLPAAINAGMVAWLFALAASSARFAKSHADEADKFASVVNFNDTASFATRTWHKNDL